MKKIFAILAAFAFVWGCEKVDCDEPVKEDAPIEEVTPDKEVPDSLLSDFVLPEILYASVSDKDGQENETTQNEEKPQTRTVVGDGKKVLWQNGDAVSYFAGNIHNARYLYTGDDGLSKVELSKDNEKVGTTGHVLLKSQAVYPYNDNITVVYEDNIDKINLTYPVTQKYGVNSFGKDANIMVAAGTHNSDDNLYFRNACGYLVIKLYGSTKVKSIILSSVNGTDKIAGPAVVVASSDAAPVVTLADEASTAVTLDCSNGGEGVQLGGDKEHATEFWFALPPVSFTDGIKITVNDVNGNTYTKQTSNQVNIVRNEVQPMAALKFESNTPAATKLWYTRSEDSTSPFEKFGCEEPFNAAISKHYYDKDLGKIVIEFASPLTTIKACAFEDTNIATIVLPEGVTTIEESAFEDSYLREITIPGSMNNIGINVFYDCDNLSSVTFLPSPTKTPLNIGCMDWGSEWGPFYDSPLTSIDLNRELICVWEDGSPFTPGSWDQGMFANEDHEDVGSVSVTLGPQVETLSKYMFAYLPIQTLTIPGSVTEIHNDVFLGCTELATLTFEPSPSGTALTMGYDTDGEDENLFQDNNKLTTLNLNREINYTFDESDITSDSEGLFGGMPTLTNVTLGDQVKTLHKYMFAGSGIQSITIHAGITSIGEYAFDACTSLTDLTFETSETALEIKGQGNSDGPFYDSPLTAINYNRNFVYKKVNGEEFVPSDDSDGIFAISEDARNKVTATPSTVNIGGLIETIPDRMFCNLPITTLTIPGTVTSIGNDVFNGCNHLATLTFEPSETSPATGLTLGYNSDGEEEGPFLNSPLTSVNLNREITYTLAGIDLDYDDEGIFYGKSLDAGVIIGEQVRTLSDYMFSGSGINSLTIPATLTKIGAYAFNNCTNLETLTFEESTTPLEIMGQGDSDGPFYDSPLTTINYNRNFVYKKVNGEDFIPSDDSDGIFAISNDAKNKITGKSVVTIGELIQTIPDYMCNNLAITELTIPNTVANLGMHAFLNCDRLSNITIQDDTNSLNLQTQRYSAMGPFYNSPLTDIHLGREILYNGGAYNPGASGSGIFYSVKYEEVDEVDLSISNNVKTISPYMFARLNLKSITIPASITSIGLNAFVECQSLNSIVFEDSTTPLTVSCHHTWSILGPFHQSPLTSITLGRKINYVDSNGKPFTPSETDHGFFASEHDVESLSITLTNNVQTISEYMFAGRPITQINIPASVTEIKDHAFQSCTKLASLTIPGTVNTIGNDVFNECTSLASVTFEPSPTKEALKIGYDTDGEDENLFQDSNSLTTLNLDRELDYTLTGIDTESEGLFGGMKNLTSVTLGDQVKTLFPYMFAGTGITKLVIPGTVNEIKDFAFYDCTDLEDLRFESSSNALTLGFQDWTDELGPFYQSPLKYINLERDITYNDNYAASCDGWDEGAFSNEYYDSDDYNWTARVIIGEQVTTLPKYMFATMRMQQLHIPESVENIGKGLVEKCEVLNAIVLYDTVQRPTNVEDGAFGEVENLGDVPGNYQYYFFVPYWKGYGADGIYYFNQEESYWRNFHWAMVDEIFYGEPHISNGHESRYYDTSKSGEAGIIPGYEWYYQRYYLRQDITPPTE